MSITVTVENDTIKLPPDVHVPDGTRVEITLPGGRPVRETRNALIEVSHCA